MGRPSVRIGILGLQGDYAAHAAMLDGIAGVASAVVRDPDELADVSGLIIPGGESTTIGKLMVRSGLDHAVADAARHGLPIYGTCAGMILMAREIRASDQPRLGLLDIVVARNAFGRQVDSFEADIDAPALGAEPLRGVFIRAPYATEAGPGVTVLARFDGKIVGVECGRLLATAFHPELTADPRVHERFAAHCRAYAAHGPG